MKDTVYAVHVLQGVYPPGEDTFLLHDAIEVCPQDVVLDMGCGSGYISLNLLDHVRRVIAVDIQHAAVINTCRNLMKHHASHNANVVQSDLFDALSPSFKFSLIAFNPPYLPQDEGQTSMDPALVGGEKGTEVSERFIIKSIDHLARSGRIYLIASSLGDIKYLIEVMMANGFDTTIVQETVLFFERLVVIRGTL